MTNEPFQPVRLYYAIPDRPFVEDRLRRLECMADVKRERCWEWLFEAESASLPLAVAYNAVPKERRPLILGRIRFPAAGGMTLQTNSIARAIEGARFLGPRLGLRVTAVRCRVVNRCFAADEGRPDELMATLDTNVTVIDPQAAGAAFRRDFDGVRTLDDAERAAAASIDRRLAAGDDVPPVEDFPLHPEEESPEFRDLATALQLRLVRAFEHWKGNTHVTLTSIIVGAVEQAHAADRASRKPRARYVHSNAIGRPIKRT
jgi:hypothetical protein